MVFLSQPLRLTARTQLGTASSCHFICFTVTARSKTPPAFSLHGSAHEEGLICLRHLFVDGGVDPLGPLNVVAGEDADAEHAVAVIAAVGDGDVVVVHQSVMRDPVRPIGHPDTPDPSVGRALPPSKLANVGAVNPITPGTRTASMRIILAYALRWGQGLFGGGANRREPGVYTNAL